jgi:hypothetical protein
MGKKEKSALVEDFQAMITMVPKLVALLKVNDEIAAGYQKYRKNGGAAIPGIEKHLGIKKQESAPSETTKETKAKTDTKKPKEGSAEKKGKNTKKIKI